MVLWAKSKPKKMIHSWIYSLYFILTDLFKDEMVTLFLEQLKLHFCNWFAWYGESSLI